MTRGLARRAAIGAGLGPFGPPLTRRKRQPAEGQAEPRGIAPCGEASAISQAST